MAQWDKTLALLAKLSARLLYAKLLAGGELKTHSVLYKSRWPRSERWVAG